MQLATPEFVSATVPTPPLAGEIESIGLNTSFFPAWQEQILAAAGRNAGFGEEGNGFLAWSRKGFVRLRNVNLTARQNERFALLSLQLGLPVERLPAGTQRTFATGQQRWIESFLANAEQQLRAFRAGSATSVDLRDGKFRFGLKLEESLQLPVNYYYKKRSGLKRLGRRIAREWGESIKSISGSRLLRQLAQRNSTVRRVLGEQTLAALADKDPLYGVGAAATDYGRGLQTFRAFVRSYARNYLTVASFVPSPTAGTAIAKALQISLAESVAEGRLRGRSALQAL